MNQLTDGGYICTLSREVVPGVAYFRMNTLFEDHSNNFFPSRNEAARESLYRSGGVDGTGLC